jgi:hypothetical protein
MTAIPAYFFFLMLAICSTLSSKAQPVTREYKIKAVFLFNFTQFVEWPDDSFSSAQDPLVIGILGENPFGSSLTNAVAGEKVNGHPIVIRQFSNASEIQECHILFINSSETNKMAEISANLKPAHTLIVSDDSYDFLKKGGMIRFFISENQIKLQINLKAVKAANLIISSKLLRLAEIV